MDIFSDAKWIWRGECAGRNTYAVFAGHFSYGGGKCAVYISVDTNYALYVNGVMAATGQYADYPFDKVYDVLDITPFVKNDENELRFDCYHQGDDSSTVRGEKAGLIYSVVCEGKTLAVSSENTLSAPFAAYDMGEGVEHVSGQLGYSFHYDSRRALPEMKPSDIVEKPLPARSRPVKKLEVKPDEPSSLTVRGSFYDTREGNPAQRMQYSALEFADPNVASPLPCENGIEIKAGGGNGIFALIDTGRENAGILSLDIELPCDGEILCGWGEHTEDMRVRAFVGGRCFCASFYGKKGRNTFVHPFRRLGMRYLQLNIYAPSAKIYYAGIKPTDYPLTFVPFTCADSLHNRVYEVCLRTLQMCMHEHYEDCPWREQALYAMDSRNQMLCGYYAFREFDFAKASIRLMAQSIREDDMLELCSPARVGITIPSFTAIFLTQAWEYVEYSGDIAFMEEILPVMLRIADAFIARIDAEKGLIPCYGEAQYWNFYEWQSGLEGSISGSITDENITFDAPLNAFVAFGLNSLVRAAKAFDPDGDYSMYESARRSLTRAVNKYFWNPEKGVYASYLNKKGEIYHYCELTNSLILYAAGEENPARSERVREALAAETLIPVTLSHSIFKYDALMAEPEKYARYVFGDIAVKWGKMLSKDATTFWETIDGAPAFGNAGSLCHGWSAIPAYIYHRYALSLPGNITGLYECRAGR